MNRSQALASSPEFFRRYIEQVPDGDLLELMDQQLGRLHTVLLRWPADRWDHRYDVGKWSVKEVVGHMTDTERIFGYRALRIARKDATDLAGYDEDDFVAHGDFGDRTGMELLEEFDLCRRANLVLLRSLPAEAFGRLGTADGLLTSVGAIGWSMVGHVRHHLRVLEERYQES